MSSTTTKSRTTTAPSDAADRGLHVVTSNDHQHTGKQTADDKVWTALQDNPGATTAMLALSAGVGRSTAAKILNRWDGEGTVTRTPGEGQRSPDTWTVATSDDDRTEHEPTGTDATATEATVSATTEDHASADSATVAKPNWDTTTADNESIEAPSLTVEESTGAADTSDGNTTAEAAAADAQPAPDGTDEADAQPTESAVDPEPAAAVGFEKKLRLPKGGLRGMVEDYLAEHPAESFGPTKIGKDLGRSGGAVSNALDTLVKSGYAIRTCEAPKRFRYNTQATEPK